jgi:hypothetical protein
MTAYKAWEQVRNAYLAKEISFDELMEQFVKSTSCDHEAKGAEQ